MDCGLAGPEGDLFFRFPLSFLPLAPLYTPCVLRVAPLCAFFLIHSSDLSKKEKQETFTDQKKKKKKEKQETFSREDRAL
jgi:hypothetical protein